MMLLEHLHLTSLYCCWGMWSKGFTVAASTCVTTTAACVGVKHCIRVVSVRHVRRHELDCGRQLELVGRNIAVIQSQDNCWGNMYNSLWGRACRRWSDFMFSVTEEPEVGNVSAL